MKRSSTIILTLFMLANPLHAAGGGGDPTGYYTEEHIYVSRPNPASEKFFGVIGTTGLKPRIYPGVVLKVEEMVPGSPSEGKFTKGEIITGINGTVLKGLNPFVAMGNALTKAEATDGKMTFDVTSADGKTQRKETVTIPVLGAYSETWPLDCPKSKRIIEEATAFYSDPAKFKQGGIPGALACLFLLSTGDDKYLPYVKAYFDAFPKDVKAIGDHTWNNGYNGIACGEYYLRTGDKSVLPILQHYCDDARDRQMFDCGWSHWGYGINPGYVAGGLVNAAGTPLLTVMLLGKECGVNVDEKTLLNALRFHYRFVGHGGAAYGDHRAEGWHCANGKDGMAAAALLLASGADGDTSAYREAVKSLSMGTIEGYLWTAIGHGDEGRSDGIWRGITTSHLMKEKPEKFREHMNRLTWWHDLSREHGGSIGIATCDFYGAAVGSSGAGIGLTYTAPLKKLRINGAPRTEHSKKFTLPENIWGTAADRAFLSIDHNPKFASFDGEDEPLHVIFRKLSYSDYRQADFDPTKIPRSYLLKNIHHWSYVVRTEAAKTLCKVGAFDELEKLLSDPDPRLRCAALDGLNDWGYWFGPGNSPISTEQLTPGMLTAITRMLSDPEESWYVKAAAMMSLKHDPAKEIAEQYDLLEQYSRHADWWMREAAFTAITGLQKDDALYLKALPTLIKIATSEYHTMPREWMMNHLKSVFQTKKLDSEEGKLIVAALREAVSTNEIKSGYRSQEGAYNVAQAMKFCLQSDPTVALELAQALVPRIESIGNGDLMNIVGSPSRNPTGQPSLYSAMDKLNPEKREKLKRLLHDTYRASFVKRYKAGDAIGDDGAVRPAMVNTLIDLKKLRDPDAGWKALGKVKPSERLWRFKSVDPMVENDKLKINGKEWHRFRDIELASELKDWFKPGYDDSKWNSGRAPIGKGIYKQGDASIANQSEWGDGEFIVMRTTFEVDALDFDFYRLAILSPQGYRVYLNGHEIVSYGWWGDRPSYSGWELDSGKTQHLKKGTNVLAAYGVMAYNPQTKEPLAQMDLMIEGLKLKDLE